MFIPEDGTGLVSANSYITLAFADSYFAERAINGWTGTDAAKQAAAIKATDYIETVYGGRFKGLPLTTAQALSFPRDVEGELPLTLRKATAEYALRALSNPLAPDPVVDTSGMRIKSKTEQLGPLKETTEYADGGPLPYKSYPAADALMRLLVRSAGRLVR